MRNENSNTGVYDQFLVVVQLIQPKYIFVNKMKPFIDEITYKTKQKLEKVFLKFLQLEVNI